MFRLAHSVWFQPRTKSTVKLAANCSSAPGATPRRTWMAMFEAVQGKITLQYATGCSQSMNSKMKNAKNKRWDQKNKLSTRFWSSTASIPSRCMPQRGIWREPQSENSQIALRVTQVYSFISELIRRWQRDLTTKSPWSTKLGRPNFNDQPNSICYSVGLPNLLTFFGLSFCYSFFSWSIKITKNSIAFLIVWACNFAQHRLHATHGGEL